MTLTERTNRAVGAEEQDAPRDAEPDGQSDGSGRPGWLDLVLVGAVALAGLAATGLPVPLRVPLGLLAVLFAPGYALIAALFPTSEQVDRLERLGLALGTSLAMIILQALVLHVLPGGLAPTAIQATVVGTTLVLLVAAAARRARTRTRSSATSEAEPGRPPRRAIRFTQALVIANLVAAALAYAVTVGGTAERPTAFYVLGQGDALAEYPRRGAPGETIRVKVGIAQATDRAGSYAVVARQRDRVVGMLEAISVAPGRVSETELPIVLGAAGPDEEVIIDLRQIGEERAFRTLRLWVDVGERESP